MESGNGTIISFHNVKYTVDVRAGCCKSAEKTILNNVDGLFKPGMNAIMGPTGSGKTSLLDTIAGRKDPSGVSGDVLVDGNPQPKNFKCMTGYVVQDDVVMGTLTVRENLMFSANLRFPKTMSHDEKCQRVEDTISELGLTACADSKVGNEFIRGISGGERKRTNIGMELIISPSVLFLDEPTTGLDASTSYAVLYLLSNISKKGKTIIFSIHQPRYSIFKLFDNLMLLSRGLAVYHGPAKHGLDYFSSIGFDCEEHDNPADFFLDVVNGDSSAIKGLQDAPNKKQNGHAGRDIVSAGNVTVVSVKTSNGKIVPGENGHSQNGAVAVVMSAEDEPENSLAQQLSEKYKASHYHSDLMREAQPIFDEYDRRVKSGEKVERAVGEYATNFLTQFSYLSKRALLNLVRNPMATMMQCSVMLILGVLTGVLYLDLDDTAIPGIQNRVGLVFFAVMNMVFSNIAAVEVFIKERVIFIHENASGFYRVSAYFFSKIFCDMIPMRIIPLVFYVCIVYFMTGLRPGADHFFIFCLGLLLVSMCAASIGFFMGSSVGVFAIANLFLALTFVCMMIFGGLFVNIDSIWVGIRWIQYFSMFRYTLNILSINELKGVEFFNVVNGNKTSAGFGEDLYLRDQGIAYTTAWDLWQNVLALCCIILGFLVLAYIQLRRIKKYK